MTRGKKLLILAGALVLVCGAALLALNLSPAEDQVVEDTGTVILSVDSTAVTGMSWTYTETLAFAYDGTDWSYTTDSSFPVNGSYLDAMVSALSEVCASTAIDAPEDLSQYGLDAPLCTVTVTTAEGDQTLSIGSESALGGERYVTLDGTAVYLVSSDLLNNFEYGLYDLVETETIPAMNDITGFTVQADTQTLTIQHLEDSGLAYSDSYEWFAEEDSGYVTLDTSLTQALTGEVTGLTWESCVDYAADEASLAVYGLTDPACTVTITYIETEGGAEKTFGLELGGYSGSSCYARLAGSSMVYLVDAAVSDTLLYTTVEELLPDDVLEMDWDEVTELDITLDGVTYTLIHETVEETDEEGTVTETTRWTKDGEELSLTSALNALTGYASTGYATGITPERDAVLSLVIRREVENWQEVEVVFYAYDSESCLVTLNGESTVFVARTDIDDLTATLAELLTPAETEE